MFDLQIPFFIPVWRRIAVIVVCIGWGTVEFLTATPFWGTLFCGIGVYSAWQFFFDGWPSRGDGEAE